MELIQYLSNFISISKPLETEINSITKFVFFSKGQIIITNNERCDSMFFIVKGLVRGYYLDDDGKDVTNWFAQESEFATCSAATLYPASLSLFASINSLTTVVVSL